VLAAALPAEFKEATQTNCWVAIHLMGWRVWIFNRVNPPGQIISRRCRFYGVRIGDFTEVWVASIVFESRRFNATSSGIVVVHTSLRVDCVNELRINGVENFKNRVPIVSLFAPLVVDIDTQLDIMRQRAYTFKTSIPREILI
jgi:hypothetical protein